MNVHSNAKLGPAGRRALVARARARWVERVQRASLRLVAKVVPRPAGRRRGVQHAAVFSGTGSSRRIALLLQSLPQPIAGSHSHTHGVDFCCKGPPPRGRTLTI
jgi:hypothetical protein